MANFSQAVDIILICITTACTGDLHCVQLAALRAPVSARNAGAVMLQAGRHRASTHKGVKRLRFHGHAFAARVRLHSYWHAARPTLRPLPSAQDIFSLQPLRAPAFGGFVLICDVLCHILGPTRALRRLFRCTASAREVFQELIALI